MATALLAAVLIARSWMRQEDDAAVLRHAASCMASIADDAQWAPTPDERAFVGLDREQAVELAQQQGKTHRVEPPHGPDTCTHEAMVIVAHVHLFLDSDDRVILAGYG